jgi:cation/acetate symporter
VAHAELREQSQVGEALVRGLVRTQLGLALRLAAVVGGGAAAGAVLLTVLGGQLTSWVQPLVAQPAAWSVQLAFAVMVVVSLVTRSMAPAGIASIMLRLHAHDALRL